jgi:hypothetical protein
LHFGVIKGLLRKWIICFDFINENCHLCSAIIKSFMLILGLTLAVFAVLAIGLLAQTGTAKR